MGSPRGALAPMGSEAPPFDTGDQPRQWSRKQHRRTQFIKRAVDFANRHGISIQLAYYPPYHSKYNPVERTHGALEQYWNGMLLTDAETTIKIAENMTWKGNHPVVTLVTRVYENGVKLTKKAMAACEKMINRMPGLEDWFVDIRPSPG